MSAFTESVVEDAALAWLEALGYALLHWPRIAAGEPGAERNDQNYRDVILEIRLRDALARLNPALQPEALDDAWRKLTRVGAPSLVERNRAVHRMLVDGVTVELRRTVVQSLSFAELLEQAVRKYQNRAIDRARAGRGMWASA